jgi:sterol desaturase/sphingolipid hydroxylase (fatty acid hydroxylase superfamily)
MQGWLAESAMQAPYASVAAATVLWFTLIYGVIAGGAFLLAVDRLPDLRRGQLRDELLLSAASILVFALQAVLLVWLLRRGLIDISWQRSPWHLAWELPVLYLWNEIHFLAVHRLLHWRPLYRAVHVWHHRSVVTTPFSAYSFHPVESFLLGAVLPLALLAHAFSPWALLGLTLMSLLLNVSGHLPHERLRSTFAFAGAHSRFHNRHHREFRVHYSFSLPFLDRLPRA